MSKLSTTRRSWFRLIADQGEYGIVNLLLKLKVIDRPCYNDFHIDTATIYNEWDDEKHRRIRKSEARYQSKHRDSGAMKPIKPTKQRKF